MIIFFFFSAPPGADVNCFRFSQSAPLSNTSNGHRVRMCVKQTPHSQTHTHRLTFLVRQHQIFLSSVTSNSQACLIGALDHVWKSEDTQRKTAETTAVTWTHFYCNSSIESKKVLININTMPMLKSPLSTPPTPLSLHEEKTERKKERRK